MSTISFDFLIWHFWSSSRRKRSTRASTSYHADLYNCKLSCWSDLMHFIHSPCCNTNHGNHTRRLGTKLQQITSIKHQYWLQTSRHVHRKRVQVFKCSILSEIIIWKEGFRSCKSRHQSNQEFWQLSEILDQNKMFSRKLRELPFRRNWTNTRKTIADIQGCAEIQAIHHQSSVQGSDPFVCTRDAFSHHQLGKEQHCAASCKICENKTQAYHANTKSSQQKLKIPLQLKV